MKKALIISWYFPPCNLTASQRASAWEKYFHLKGIFPIVVTRNWDIAINDQNDIEKPAGSVANVIDTDTSQIHYVPYEGALRNKLEKKNRFFKISIIKKIVLLFELMLENVFSSITPFKRVIKYSLQLIKEQEIDIIIITGNPFHLFKLGYIAKKKYNIPWVADYRDGWTENEVPNIPIKFFNFIKNKIDSYYERKWVRSASFFTTVSEPLAEKIENKVKKTGTTIYNGFFDEEINSLESHTNFQRKHEFVICYSGTLYTATQPVTIIFNALKIVVKKLKENNISIKPVLYFLGAAYDSKVSKIILENNEAIADNIKLTKRVSRIEALQIQSQCDALLMIPHVGTKGVMSSKIFEYMALKKPIIIAPSVGDIIEKTTIEAGLAITAVDENVLADKIFALIVGKQSQSEQHTLIPNTEFINSFSRKNQCFILADKMLNIDKN